ncbi:MAG: VOC family protein [Acidimicrobiales bacterium]
MPTRTTAPLGSPCWADLWTSDVEGSRRFYGELFGWESDDPDPQFGGYFIFNLNGVQIAGGMGDMGEDMRANDTWKVYFNTDNIEKTIEAAEANGAQIVSGAMAVADLGVQAVLVDPSGAAHGMWEPKSFQGFTVLNEPGAPSWFELMTRDYEGALSFYRTVYRWETDVVDDSDEFRYTTVRNPDGEGEVAGIMDASAFLPEGVPSNWRVYWEVDDVDAALGTVTGLGGTILMPAQDTPYGRLAQVADPAGAAFNLRKPPS